MGGRNKTPHTSDRTCRIAAGTIYLLAGKWTIRVILVLAAGKQWFAAL